MTSLPSHLVEMSCTIETSLETLKPILSVRKDTFSSPTLAIAGTITHNDSLCNLTFRSSPQVGREALLTLGEYLTAQKECYLFKYSTQLDGLETRVLERGCHGLRSYNHESYIYLLLDSARKWA